MFKEGNFIKEKVQGSKQWKVMKDTGIWYEILNCQQRVMLFHRVAHKHWKLVAEDDRYLWLAGKEFKSKENEKRIRTKAR